MVIVETAHELDLFLSKLRVDSCIVDVVMCDVEKHALNNLPSLIITIFPAQGDLWVIPISHNEGLSLDGSLDKVRENLKMCMGRKCTFDKKTLVHVFGEDCGFVDLNVVKYLDTGCFEEFEDVSNSASVFISGTFRRFSNLNKSIPIMKHCDLFMQKYLKFVFPPKETSFDKSFEFVNNIAITRFAELERIGIAVDKEKLILQFGEEQEKNVKNNLIYSQYNLFTSTGRPSNRFGGVNYAALNKTDGSRNLFVSRHGPDGMLVMIDYSAFHPRLITRLINYQMGFDVNPYEYLAKHFFKKKNVSMKEIGETKGYTFQQFYGGIQQRWAHIPYFKKIQEYIDHRWQYFEANGFVETPVYFRKIKECHIENPSPNKLFNYILQAYETEIGVLTLGRILDHLKGRLTQPTLYTYDSLLFDAHRQDGQETIRQLRDIMVDNKFPVKVYVGKNYAEMSQIEL